MNDLKNKVPEPRLHGVPIVWVEEYDGKRCPACSSLNIVAGDLEPIGLPGGHRHAHCRTCHARWVERMVVTAYCSLKQARARGKDANAEASRDQAGSS